MDKISPHSISVFKRAQRVNLRILPVIARDYYKRDRTAHLYETQSKINIWFPRKRYLKLEGPKGSGDNTLWREGRINAISAPACACVRRHFGSAFGVPLSESKILARLFFFAPSSFFLPIFWRADRVSSSLPSIVRPSVRPFRNVLHKWVNQAVFFMGEPFSKWNARSAFPSDELGIYYTFLNNSYHK